MPAPSILATAGALLIQLPPGVVFDNVIDDPEHTVDAPVIAAGSAFTTTEAVDLHVVGNVYVILDTPAMPPITTPDEVIVAIDGVPLLHIPPGVTSLSVVVDPAHTFRIPKIGAGSGFTLIVVVRAQPAIVKHVIVTAPALTPVTVPNASTVAIAVLPDAQFVAVALVSVIEEPSHTFEGPLIAVGNAFTVKPVDVLQPAGRVYVILVIPAVAPLTTPALLTGAITDDPVLHTPPDGVLLSVLVWPTQVIGVPLIAVGVWFTFTTRERIQPVGNV